MKDGFLKIAAAVPRLRAGDTAHNAGEAVRLARDAASLGVKICVFPELTLTGATCGDLFRQETLLDGAERALLAVQEATRELDVLLVVGLPVRNGERVYNAAALLHRGRLLGTAVKTRLTSREQRWFASDAGALPVLTGAFRAEGVRGLTVQVAFPGDEPSQNALLLLCPDASPETAGAASKRRGRLRVLTREHICGVVLAGAGPGESTANAVYGGHAAIVENGEVLAESRFREGLTVSEVDIAALIYARRRSETTAPDASDVACALEPCETVLTRTFSPAPFAETDCGEVFTLQTLGLRKRLERTGAKRLVVGVSGGLDSALALLTASEAVKDIPGTSVLAVTMPCFGTTERTKNNAVRLAELLGAEIRTVDIAESVRLHFRDIGHDESVRDAVYENAQARERTQVLMDLANAEGGFVVGTGDMSELALGWCTYNGDHMSIYNVNAGVPKTLVRAVADWYAGTCGEALGEVLRDILATPVSPELKPGQVTEDVLGPYELHDFFLWHFLRGGASPEKLLRLAEYAFRDVYGRETVLKWLKVFFRRFFAQQYKRSCAPDGPRVLETSLSPRDGFVMPSDVSPEAWISELEALS